MVDNLIAAGRAVEARRDCRAVVLSGAGRGFSSGIDLDVVRASASGQGRAIDLATEKAKGANARQHAAMLWRALPVPVIATIHSPPLGGGFQIALGADMRIVHPLAKLSVMEIKWGLIPDMSGMACCPACCRAMFLPTSSSPVACPDAPGQARNAGNGSRDSKFLTDA